MCGIVGVISADGSDRKGALLAARDAMAHRGPDDAGVWWSERGHVGLAHRRLSIIDLSPTGHQPMRANDGAMTIVFNGEIYNHGDLRSELESKGHAFRGRSDTEVLLAAYHEWGVECLSRLNGAFAFCIYDSRSERLFLARDRAGEKPLFYRQAPGSMWFASELKALMTDPSLDRVLDPEAFDCYLAYGYVPGERCILRGVKKLPPGHSMVYDLVSGEARVRRYWDLPAPPPEDIGDDVVLLEELESLLADSVRRQMLSDVPVGVLLSGGVDSSIITALAARTAQRVKTFTIRFPGFGGYDETTHARLVADHFGTQHTELDAAGTTPDILPVLARQFDEPIADSSLIPTHLVCQLTREHCTVALGGDGGDELFGGYGRYDRWLRLSRRLSLIPHAMRAALADAAVRTLPVGFKGRNWLQAIGAEFSGSLPTASIYFDRHERGRLLMRGRQLAEDAEFIRERRIPVVRDILQRATRMDFLDYMPEDILVKVDRTSMLNSLEVRAPLLDYRVIEFAFGRVPSRLKATHFSRKILLKRLCAKLLPAGFELERKQGFSIPLSEWMRQEPWRTSVRDTLHGARESPFNQAYVTALIRGLDSHRANGERLFALMMFELWRREYKVSYG